MIRILALLLVLGTGYWGLGIGNPAPRPQSPIPSPQQSFTARWAGNHTARLEWQQPADVALTCLYKGTTLIRCWPQLDPGQTFTTIGDRGPLDYSAHPAIGDIYTLDQDGAVTRAELRFVLALPIATQPPGVRRLWLGAIESP